MQIKILSFSLPPYCRQTRTPGHEESFSALAVNYDFPLARLRTII